MLSRRQAGQVEKLGDSNSPATWIHGLSADPRARRTAHTACLASRCWRQGKAPKPPARGWPTSKSPRTPANPALFLRSTSRAVAFSSSSKHLASDREVGRPANSP